MPTQTEINERKARGSQRVKPILVKVHIVYIKTVFDTPNKVRNARENGTLTFIRRDGRIWYDLSTLDKILLKTA